MKRFAGILVALCLLAGAACADTISTSGTVTAGTVVAIQAPIGGTVEIVAAEKGMDVQAGDTLVTLKTTKIYAPADGTVTGIFVAPGDDAESVANTFGADMYLEGSMKYTVSASTGKAYSSIETTFVHVGETVYLQCRSNNARTGVGLITAVEGNSYTIQVTEGDFILGDSVYVFRDSGYVTTGKIGQGSVSRVNPQGITASGAVVSVAVKNGDQVKKGDLLMETLDGTWEGYVAGSREIQANMDGVIAEVSATVGSALSQGATVVTLYPRTGMRVETVVEADDLSEVKVGDTVRLELSADESKVYTGTVERISALAEDSTDSESAVSYRVYITFTPDEAVAFGMEMDVIFGGETEAVEPQEAQEAPAAEETEEPQEAAEAQE